MRVTVTETAKYIIDAPDGSTAENVIDRFKTLRPSIREIITQDVDMTDLNNIRECPECSCQDQWESHGHLGADNDQVLACNDCDHIEYRKDSAIYLDEDQKEVEVYHD